MNGTKNSSSTKRSAETGQSLVEFALIMPIVLVLLLGAIDIGLGFRTYMGLTNAAREGVRWVSIHPDDVAGARGRISEEAARVNLSDAEISVQGLIDAGYSAGDKAVVTVSYEYELLFGALTGVPSIPFETSSTMVVLYDGS